MDIRQMSLSQSYAEFIVPELFPDKKILEKYKAELFQPIGLNFSTIFVPLEKTKDFTFSNYDYNMFPKIYAPLGIQPLEETGIEKLASGKALKLTGKGVIVGVIDTGIDFTLPVFMGLGNKTRILRLWDQTAAGGLLPSVYEGALKYGSEYTQDEINAAILSDNPFERIPSRDVSGHGTFVASAAAGSRLLDEDFSGAASNASIVAVRLKEAKTYLKEFYGIPADTLCYQENDIIAAANYVRACARYYDMPVVLLVALGSSQGPHSGSGALCMELDDFKNTAGSAVVVAAGNEGMSAGHGFGQASSSSCGESELKIPKDVSGFSMEIWARIPSVLSVSLTSPTGESTGRIQAAAGKSESFDFIFDGTSVFVQYEINEAYSGKELIFVRFEKPSAGVWTVRLYSDSKDFAGYDIWLPMKSMTGMQGENLAFLKPEPDVTATDPSMASSVITVAGYDSYSGAYYADSGRGYSRSGAVKPDITAPAVNVYGAYLKNIRPFSGTSAAAALTAGAAAQYLEWAAANKENGAIYSNEVKSRLIRGAVRRDDISYPDARWGYGTLNIYNTFEVMRGGSPLERMKN